MSAVGGGPGIDIEVLIPAGWVRRRNVAGMALLAQPDHWHAEPRPTLAVAAIHTPDRPTFDDYADLQLEGLAATFGGRLLHLARHAATHTLDIAVSTEVLGSDVTSVQRHLVDADGRALVATGTAADTDWPVAGPGLVEAVRSLRYERP